MNKTSVNGKTFHKEAVILVKGVSRQVIVVHSPDPKLFDQAIFILKDEAVGQGITEEALLKEAQQIIRGPQKRNSFIFTALYGPAAAHW